MAAAVELRALEAALVKAVRASLPCSQAARAAFVFKHLQAQVEKTELPTAAGERQGSPEELQAELTVLSELLTSCVNSARGQPGWPMDAVIAALAKRTLADVASVVADAPADPPRPPKNATKLAACDAAIKIVEDAKSALPDVAPMTELKITRPFEDRWGDRELEFMARALEHWESDAELHGFLAARQRLEDAKMADVMRDLDKQLALLGVKVDAYGLVGTRPTPPLPQPPPPAALGYTYHFFPSRIRLHHSHSCLTPSLPR